MNCLKYQILFPILACMLMFSCTQEDDAVVKDGDAVELTGVKTVIGSMTTRADNNDGLQPKGTAGYIGREFFVADDQMTLTKFQRTENPILDYSYTGLNFTSNADGAWSRENSDRIYWTDNANPHTIIGYSCPKEWNTNKWVTGLNEVNTNYFGQFTHNEGVVDFSDSTKIAAEDLLLTYNTEMQSEPGGYVAVLHYRHALASAKVVVNIMNFAADDKSEDVKTTVSDLQILNQPWKYKWAQTPVDGVNGINHPGWGVQKRDPAQEEAQSVTLKTWLRDSVGIGENRNKTFTFRSLIVPGQQNQVKIRFKVKYPNAQNPQEKVEKTYTATLNHSGTPETSSYREGVFFEPGKTTQINISLNHKNEQITIGAEYIDWENVETPDQTNLSKYSTYLSTNKRSDVTIHTDTKATIEDATWLYKNTHGDIVDIYGNNGTTEYPYTIKTALQFLSFAYEVNNGFEFNDKHVKLDASLVLQPVTEPDGKKPSQWATTQWIGIGDGSHAFNGTFIGTTRYVRYLYGKPLFNNIGANGKVCGLTLENVIGVTSGGMIADKNAGNICGCIASIHNLSNKDDSYSYFGSFSGLCGTNSGSITACGTIGPDDCKATATAGICGNNSGTITACYSGIKSAAGVANGGTVTGCFYDSDKATGTAADGSTAKTTEQMQLKSLVDALNDALETNGSEHSFEYRAAFYPNVR